jgi:hypothetical protein
MDQWNEFNDISDRHKDLVIHELANQVRTSIRDDTSAKKALEVLTRIAKGQTNNIKINIVS